MLGAVEAQDEVHALGMWFEDRLQLLVDEAHSTFNHAKVEGLIRRAGLRYPGVDPQHLDLVDERGLDRAVIAQLATCSFIDRQQNVVFQGFTGSGKSYLGCALAKQACQHRIRAHDIRMPDLEEPWALAKDIPQGQTKCLKKYAAFSLLVIDEWLLNQPDEAMRSMLLELPERRYDAGSKVFCTQYAKKDWHQRLGPAVHANAIMDRIVQNTICIDIGSQNMREHAAMARGPHAGGSQWPPQQRLLALAGKIGGPRRQYSVAPRPPSTYTERMQMTPEGLYGLRKSVALLRRKHGLAGTSRSAADRAMLILGLEGVTDAVKPGTAHVRDEHIPAIYFK